MKKTPSIYRLNPEWQTLQSAGLEQLALLIPSCDRLDRLVRTIRTLVKVRQTYQTDIVRPLQACREKIIPLMEANDRIPHLVNAAKAIALVVRVCDAEWKPLLQDVCSLLSVQLQSCDNITHVVQILDCLTRLSPLIGEAVEAEESPECAEEPAACLQERKRPGDEESISNQAPTISPEKVQQILTEAEEQVRLARIRLRMAHNREDRLTARNNLKELKEYVRYLHSVKQKAVACK